jgi:benzylsuccinate CoA-transferase BbsE subunit
VVEVDDGLAQYAGKILADLGATVIKVEPPTGSRQRETGPVCTGADGSRLSIPFLYYNTCKQSVTLDLGSDDGQRRFAALLARADILLDGLGVGRLGGFGLTEQWLSAARPGIVYVTITPFGRTGPWRDYQSSDLVSLAVGGVTGACGYTAEDGRPSEPVTPAGGHAVQFGGVIAATTAVAALRDRPTAGLRSVDVSIHDCVAVSTEIPVSMWEFGQQDVHRHTAEHVSKFPAARPWLFQAGDGAYVCALTSYFTDKRFRALVTWFDDTGFEHGLQLDQLASESQREAGFGPIADSIARFCRLHTADYLFEEGQRRLLPWAKVRSPRDLLSDPHLAERGFFAPVPIAGHGAVPFATSPFTGMETALTHPDTGRVRPPALGEDTEAVFGQLDPARTS